VQPHAPQPALKELDLSRVCLHPHGAPCDRLVLDGRLDTQDARVEAWRGGVRGSGEVFVSAALWRACGRRSHPECSSQRQLGLNRTLNQASTTSLHSPTPPLPPHVPAAMAALMTRLLWLYSSGPPGATASLPYTSAPAPAAAPAAPDTVAPCCCRLARCLLYQGGRKPRCVRVLAKSSRPLAIASHT
jgi:hypothetical protein